MAGALYGRDGFYRRSAPVEHFRTSAHTGAVFATAILMLLDRIDAALGGPARLDLVDIGAGRGELLLGVVQSAAPGLRERLRPIAVEVAERPEGLDPSIAWHQEVPTHISGLVIATEWLDNVPLDIAERVDGDWRYVLVDAEGTESLGDPVDGADLDWIAREWPVGPRAEIGRPRDEAWAGVVARIDAGLALAIDYGHLRDARPRFGTLTGFRQGREVHPVPDGSCDVTAHVAVDAVAAAGSAVAGLRPHVVRQADVLRALGVSGRRPDLALARTDPAAYVRALVGAGAAAELTDESGLGEHFWVQQPVAIRWQA